MATTFDTVVPNICEPTVGNFLGVTVLAPRIARWRLHFFSICAQLFYSLANLSDTYTGPMLTTLYQSKINIKSNQHTGLLRYPLIWRYQLSICLNDRETTATDLENHFYTLSKKVQITKLNEHILYLPIVPPTGQNNTRSFILTPSARL